MRLETWRGDPVIPAAWLIGYRHVYPMMREPAAETGPRQQARAARLARALRAVTEDGRPEPPELEK